MHAASSAPAAAALRCGRGESTATAAGDAAISAALTAARCAQARGVWVFATSRARMRERRDDNVSGPGSRLKAAPTAQRRPQGAPRRVGGEHVLNVQIVKLCIAILVVAGAECLHKTSPRRVRAERLRQLAARGRRGPRALFEGLIRWLQGGLRLVRALSRKAPAGYDAQRRFQVKAQLRRNRQVACTEDPARLRSVLQPRVLFGGALRVPKPADRTRHA
mmetsp:Transcript_19477/g.56611  ORF Transcript_19477/g.56611 Transcript_19477/m.56611 type:complete len:220 (-) Transcript_19477:1496-2155(-)